MGRPRPYRQLFVGPGPNRRGTHRAYLCEWSVIVGQRIRRLREQRGLTLGQVALAMEKPEGGHYSPGYISRIERGWASATFYAYLSIAAALDVEPANLLGPDPGAEALSEGDAMLLRCVAALGLEPHEAILRVSAGQARATEISSSRPSIAARSPSTSAPS